MDYELDIDKVKKEIKKKNPEKILIQLPEGLKPISKEIIDKLKENKNLEITLDGETVYGACCIPNEKERNQYDLIIHFGHTKFTPTKNVVYIPAKSTKEVHEVTKKAAEKAKGNKIGITTTTQHLHKLNEMKKAIKKTGKKPITSKEKKLVKEAQVLGCCFKAATDIQKDVDSFLFIGSGKFHPQGIANTTEKPVIQGNPYTKQITEIKENKWMKNKELRKDKARNAETFAIIETPHPGQTNPNKTKEIKKKLEKNNKKTYTIKSRNITPNKLDYLPFDAFIINACPRIVLDDWNNYKKPILLPKEAKELTNP